MINPETIIEPLTAAQAKDMFKRVFGSIEGQRALLYILTKVGGVYDLRKSMDAQARLVGDGRREAALEIMHLSGFSPLHLADRLMRLPPLTKDPDHATLPDAAPAKGQRRARRREPAGAATSSAISSAALGDAHTFAGDT